MTAGQLQNPMVSDSQAMAAVRRFIEKVAAIDSTVLVLGESGTGKELVARAIHDKSDRAAGPFVAVNCGALSEHLVESELFGHERGAFTGAAARKIGKFEQASGGTLFLDEIGDMALAAQVKLLRACQERVIDRIGGTAPVRVDIRIVAATNRDLETAIADGLFREDLYYRLNVLCVTIPPLRDRPEDILPLASHFLRKYAERWGRDVRGISQEVETILYRYDWPGNVRQLANVIERCVALCTAGLLVWEDLPDDLFRSPSGFQQKSKNYHQMVDDAKRQIVGNAIHLCRGHYAKAAEILDVHPNYVHRLARNLNLGHMLGDDRKPARD